MFIFFSKSANPPFGDIYRSALTYIPILRAFRTTAYLILVAAVAYSLLAAFTIVEIKEYFKKNVIISKVALFALFLLLIFGSYPLIFGRATLYKLNSDNYFQHGRKIPNSYNELEKYLESDNLDAKIIAFPLTDGYESLISNPNYYGIPLLPFIISKPLISARNYDFGNNNANFAKIIEESLLKGDPDSKILVGLSNIKYIILKKETRSIDLKSADKMLIKNFTKLKEYKELILYESNNKYFLPHFYIPKKTFVIDQPSKKFPELLKIIRPSVDNFDNRIGLFFSDQNKTNIKNISKEKNWDRVNVLPTIEYKKINPTKYRVIVHKANNQFPLIFIESYHPGWKIYVSNNNDKPRKEASYYLSKESNKGTFQNNNLTDGSILEPWTSTKLQDTNHFIVNSFANSWFIDPGKFCGNASLCSRNSDGSYDFELIVLFESQKIADLGYFISFMTIVGTLSFLVFKKFKSSIIVKSQ